MKILVSCYACSPYKGSEPGMGWNFVRQIAKHHELHILVESKFQKDIEDYLMKYPEEQINKHFHFLTKSRHKLLRKIWPPSYYWFYRRWQRTAYEKAIELEASEHFDLIHQLNMVGYREPGYLWKLSLPMVWGPIGGFNITPWKMLLSMGLKGSVFYFARNILNIWQMRTSRRVRAAMRRANALIAATQNEADAIRELYNRESVIIPEVGFFGEHDSFSPRERHNALRICWCGQFTPGKSLNLLIEAAGYVTSNIELHIIGDGECAKKWKRMASKQSVKSIHWYGWVERSKGMSIMQNCDVFCITSLSDLTSTVLLEALSYGLPVIALDHCGFSNVITDECGVKIPINNKEQVVKDLAKAIDLLAADEDLRKKMSIEAFRRSRVFDWNEKRTQLDLIYSKVIES